MRRMAKIVGRTDDMLIIRGVNVFPTQIEELILKMPQLAPHYVLELTREGPLDAMTVHVECCGCSERLRRAHAAATALVEQVKSMIGVSVRVERARARFDRTFASARRSASSTSALPQR